MIYTNYCYFQNAAFSLNGSEPISQVHTLTQNNRSIIIRLIMWGNLVQRSLRNVTSHALCYFRQLWQRLSWHRLLQVLMLTTSLMLLRNSIRGWPRPLKCLRVCVPLASPQNNHSVKVLDFAYIQWQWMIAQLFCNAAIKLCTFSLTALKV